MSKVRKTQAAQAKDKKAAFGTDIDLLKYQLLSDDKTDPLDLEGLTNEDRAKIIQSGVDLDEQNRAGTFLQADNRIVHCAVKQPGPEKGEGGGSKGEGKV